MLIEHGFRLPSAADNRPLKGAEFWEKARQTVFVSATPGDWEMEVSRGEVAEQVIRPTGVLDPIVEVRPTTGEILQSMDAVNIYPAKHFVTPKDRLDSAIGAIRQELRGQLDYFNSEGKLLEAQRLEQRTKYDLEMLR